MTGRIRLDDLTSDDLDRLYDRAEDASRALGAVARVLALHEQYRSALDDTTDYCAHCNRLSGGWVPWPCPTVRAINPEPRPSGGTGPRTGLSARVSDELRPHAPVPVRAPERHAAAHTAPTTRTPKETT